MPYWYTRPFAFGPCGQRITTPLVYSQDLSIAQQIAHLFGLFKQVFDVLEGYITKDQFDDFLAWLAGEQKAQTEQLEAFAKAQDSLLRTDLEKQINDLISGMVQWNVQHGKYTSTIDAQRDMFNDLAVHALTVEQVAEQFTVEQLANSPLTVRGLAVWSGEYVKPGFVAEGIYKKEGN